MKKSIFTIILSVGFLITGCAEKKMANTVIELAGDKTVIGWDNVVSNDNGKVKTKIIKYKTQKDSDGDLIPDNLDKCPNTPLNMTVDHSGCPIITTLRLNFDTNKADVKEIYYPKLKKIAEILKNNPNLKIEIAGHTDDIGDDKYNLKLSKKRAKAVKNILVKYGIDPNRIITKGYGESYPLVPNNTITNRALNRRVEIINISNKTEFKK
jgi:OOP family OmpA-OmpF porin